MCSQEFLWNLCHVGTVDYKLVFTPLKVRSSVSGVRGKGQYLYLAWKLEGWRLRGASLCQVLIVRDSGRSKGETRIHRFSEHAMTILPQLEIKGMLMQYQPPTWKVRECLKAQMPVRSRCHDPVISVLGG